MSKGRLEAFSDGVIAIIITIMVLELKVPHDASWQALVPVASVFLSYVLSFVFLVSTGAITLRLLPGSFREIARPVA
jgi:uncharacterized membrane protein